MRRAGGGAAAENGVLLLLGLFVFVRVSLRKPRWRAEAVAAASSAVPMPRRCCR